MQGIYDGPVVMREKEREQVSELKKGEKGERKDLIFPFCFKLWNPG